MRALVTAFDPFGGAGTNASYQAVTRVPAHIGSLEVVTTFLPTSFARAGTMLIDEIQRAKPQLVLCVGEARGRTAINVERVAVNLQDARIADNDGAQPIDAPVVDGAPAAYFATLPARAIHEALIAAHLPSTLSNSAGAFVCNHVFYTLMHYAAVTHARWRGGLLHVPAWRSDSALDTGSTMTLNDLVRSIVIALEVSALDSTSRPEASGGPNPQAD